MSNKYSVNFGANENEAVFSLFIDSDLKWENALSSYIEGVMKRCNYNTSEIYAVLLSFSEAFENAIKWGNNNERNKCIAIDCDIDTYKIELSIADEGRKYFDYKNFIKDVERKMRKNSIFYILNNCKRGGQSGIGIYLMKKFMDEVEYFDIVNSFGEKSGTEVRLLYKKKDKKN